MDSLIWPTVVIIIAITVVIVLRPAFLRLIDRISKADRGGISFERPQEGGKPEPAPLSFDELMNLPITASVLDRERHIKTYLQTLNLKSDGEKIDVLIRSLSFSVLK